MTYPQEILARAMNHIDDDMILSAHGKRKKVRRVIPVLVAACLIAVLAVSFPYLREVIDTNSDLLGPADGDQGEPGVVSPKPEDTNYIEQDITTSLGGATFTLTHTTETTATFTMVKAFDVPFYAMFYDRRGGVLASTEPDYKDNGVTIRPNTIRLYVDGADQPVYQLPTAPGTYEITVDFASIRNGKYPMRECIGLYAYVGEDGEAVTVKFSLDVEEETTGAETTTDGETTANTDPAA